MNFFKDIIDKFRDFRKKFKVKGLEHKIKGTPDPKIKDLVNGLRKLSIDTISSCQGYPKRKLPYPWIDINPKNREKLLNIVFWYNVQVLIGLTENEVRWVVLPMGYMKLMPEGKTLLQGKNITLKQLQDSAVEFGKKLQELENPPKFYK